LPFLCFNLGDELKASIIIIRKGKHRKRVVYNTPQTLNAHQPKTIHRNPLNMIIAHLA
jgi:hypothetical protein